MCLAAEGMTKGIAGFAIFLAGLSERNAECSLKDCWREPERTGLPECLPCVGYFSPRYHLLLT